ncbi:hypothetical protein [Dyella agri]|uniref:Uncharacterized protein n=1 Tax=Dyella agri TaxID=1926869 RepID=A0ABW8KHE6_9GAMM
MKRMIVVTAITLALACVCGASVAQQQSQTANLQHVTVTAARGQYEAYVVNLDTGFDLEVRVGNTHMQYMQAERVTERSEALRKQGMAQSPFVAVAIDNSVGSGLARQVELRDGAQNTLAIVDVYCKQSARPDGNRCRMVSEPVSSHAYSQGLASMPMGRLSLAQVQVGSSR